MEITVKTVNEIKKDGITDEMLRQYVEFYETVDSDNLTDTVCWILAKETLALREKTRWIPVTEKLPEDSKHKLPHTAIEVLVRNIKGNFLAVLLDGEFWDEGNLIDHVTHWMPLPEPPEEA
jgi:hypothetical protein